MPKTFSVQPKHLFNNTYCLPVKDFYFSHTHITLSDEEIADIEATSDDPASKIEYIVQEQCYEKYLNSNTWDGWCHANTGQSQWWSVAEQYLRWKYSSGKVKIV